MAKSVEGLRRFGAMLLLVGILCAGGSVYLVFGYAATAIQQVEDAKAWPSTECRMTMAIVAMDFGETTTYKPMMSYTYEVDGTSYKGTRYSFVDDSGWGRDTVERLVNALQPNTLVTCYVNPADPHDVVINRDRSIRWPFLVFAAIGLAMGLGLAFVGARHVTSSRETL